MGWASGSWVARGIIDSLKKRVPDPVLRGEIYRDIIQVLEDQDWDTVDEAMGEDPAFDGAVESLHPEWFDEENLS